MVPGPGAYKNFPSFGSSGKVATIKGKVKDLTVHTNTPGPGAYNELSTLPRTGRNFYSKFKSVNTGNIGPPSNRFKDDSKSNTAIPGPGQYTPRTENGSTGKCFLSKFKNAGTLSLYRSKRETMKLPKSDRNGPGPGSYLLPSDFGYPDDFKTILHRKGTRSRKQL
jgi:hypothetical protein